MFVGRRTPAVWGWVGAPRGWPVLSDTDPKHTHYEPVKDTTVCTYMTIILSWRLFKIGLTGFELLVRRENYEYFK